MRKYIYGFKIQFLNSFHYRFNTFVEAVFGNINIIVMIFFWRVIYRSNELGVINNFTFNGMVTYFVTNILFRCFILTDSGFYVSDIIKQGSLNGVLLKPCNSGIVNYFNHLAKGVIELLPKVSLLLLFLPFISEHIIIKIKVINIIFLILFLVISTISSHLVWSIIGYSAFWIEEAEAVMWSFAVVFNFLSGMFVPLDFFPKWSVKIIERFPIATWGYIPAKVFIDLYTVEEMINIFGINLIFIGVLIIINRMIWLRGVRRYSSIGG